MKGNIKGLSRRAKARVDITYRQLRVKEFVDTVEVNYICFDVAQHRTTIRPSVAIIGGGVREVVPCLLLPRMNSD